MYIAIRSVTDVSLLLPKYLKFILISLCNRSREENDEYIFDARSSRTYLVGLCTGLLPAAALAATTSTSQLLKLAPEIVRISLRLGIEATRRSLLIERSSESWATVVSGISAREQQDILDQFNRESVST